MKIFRLSIFILSSLCLALASPAQDKKVADQIKAEKGAEPGGASGKSAPAPADQNSPWVAVHDFSIDPSLADWGLNGWDLAEKFENELTQKASYRMITRAKIAKVMKEQKVSATSSLEASKFGAMVGADFIVTGQIDRKGNKLSIIAKMIDVKRDTGKIVKSYDIAIRIAADKESLASLQRQIEILSSKLSMSPGDLLDYGINGIKSGNFEEAAASFNEIEKSIPLDEIKKLMEKYGKEAPIPIARDLKTPGDYLDYGLEEMRKGNLKEAVSSFSKLKESGATTEIRNFLELHDALKKVEAKLKEQQDKLKTVMAEADRLYLQAKAAQDKAESEMTPGELCDKALTLLDSMLADKNNFLPDDTKVDVEEMINKIKSFKTNVAGGPVPNRKWMVPDLKMQFIPIAPGVFNMGYSDAPKDADNRMHQVTLTKPFWIGQHEVTISQFLFFLQNPNGDPNEPKKADRDKEISWTNEYCPITKEYKMKDGASEYWGDENQPMVGVTWKAADLFCKWLTKREALAKRLPAGYEYRLPTEAEWEYSCRASTSKDKIPPSTSYSFGDEPEALGDFAWFKSNAGGRTNPVGKRKPNVWGLYDMHGNVWEWCYDWYGGPYLDIEVKDPKGADASEDNMKVLRGGSFMSESGDLTNANRYSLDWKASKKNVGFRVVCGPKL